MIVYQRVHLRYKRSEPQTSLNDFPRLTDVVFTAIIKRRERHSRAVNKLFSSDAALKVFPTFSRFE